MAEPLALGDLGRVMVRYWVLLLVLTLVGGAAAFGIASLLPPVYTATVTQLVKGVPGTGAAANYEAAQYSVSRAKSYPSFIESPTVLNGVLTDMNNTESLEDLQKDLSATNPTDTALIKISAEARTPELARDKANSAGRHLAQLVVQVETVAGKSPISIETPVDATLPTDTTSPKKVLLSALGALIGLVVATVIALIRTAGSAARASAKAAKAARAPKASAKANGAITAKDTGAVRAGAPKPTSATGTEEVPAGPDVKDTTVPDAHGAEARAPR